MKKDKPMSGEFMPIQVKKVPTFILDAGHGPNTLDKRSPYYPTGLYEGRPYFNEYDHNADMCNKVASRLRDLGHKVVRKDYADDSLGERVRDANAYKADHPNEDVYFISLHHDAGPVMMWRKMWHPTAKGTTAFHFTHTKEGDQLAKHIIGCLDEDKLDVKPRKFSPVKAANFNVLRYTDMTAVLIEVGFMNNWEEVQILRTEQFKQTWALSLAMALHTYEKQ